MKSRQQLNTKQKDFLRSLFPGDQSIFSSEEACVYGADASRYNDFPDAVVRPQSADQIRELFIWANAEMIPVIPRARGTNVTGACVPKGGGIVLSCLKMNAIKEVNFDDFIAIVEPGVVTADLQKKLQSNHMYYPPDPASVKISTIGGNVATNAGGMSAVKYGVTHDYVLGIEGITGEGEFLITGGRCHKDVVGLDLKRLLVGSEGTLAFFSNITLKLLPLPESSVVLLAGFDNLDQSMSAIQSVYKSGILPAAIEFMDEDVVYCLKKKGVLQDLHDVSSILIIKIDGTEYSIRHELDKIELLLKEKSAIRIEKGVSSEDQEDLWEIRRSIQSAAFIFGPDKIAVDITVPRGGVSACINKIKSISNYYGLKIITFGHLGDGNLHVNIVYNKNEPSQVQAADNATHDILQEVVHLRGTISGEHGIGLAKLPYIHYQLSDYAISLMRKMKKVFDPNNILNPGKCF